MCPVGRCAADAAAAMRRVLTRLTFWPGGTMFVSESDQWNGCLYRKLDSAIMVMKPAEDGYRYDAARVLNGAMDRSVFVERPMSPQLVVVDGITSSEFGAGAPRPRRQYGRRTPDRSIRSIFRQSRSAKVSLGRWACHECPWRAIGARQQRHRRDPDHGSGSAASFQGNASVIWRAIHSAVGFVVTR
jgi:hypothetical protein